ncbi:M4 family metallopeptidase [Nocardioides sp. AX2bis]|uniref:M4 family metallopeptidase n=1 Tax=Nocardioides sp. AX2bis TaxID=2653157 RepID=UPI0012F219B0|nr:M4 family metallopeptidase [Nocardioides sp. AX2bis]VXB97032.1 Peptidase [Nocardioides sp. AX2bis]
MHRPSLVAVALLCVSGAATALAAPGQAAPATPAAGAARAAAAAPDGGARAVAARDDARRAARDLAGLGARDALVATDTVLEPQGRSHVRFQRTYAGLEVVGGDVVLHQGGADGDSLTGPTTRVRVATRPTVAAASATRTARAQLDLQDESARRDLVVLAVGDPPRLAWRVEVRGARADGSPAGELVFVAARGSDGSGGVLDRWPSVLAETGTGQGRYVGTVPVEATRGSQGVFSMVDPTRGASRTYDVSLGRRGVYPVVTDADNTWGDGTLADPQTTAVDAHQGAATTWDFYEDRFGRIGIGDDGVGASSLVHAGRFANAFWDDYCFCMTYGDGGGGLGPLTSYDIVGHEMTHGVTSASAGLVYRGESGGLNEATSDILGTMVEFSAGSATDPGDYVLGSEVFKKYDPATRYIRRMDDPRADGRSLSCYSPRAASVDVHYSSGPANHFFYLLAEGSGAKEINGIAYDSPTCNGAAVSGIGREEATAIWYRALTIYMTPRTDYRAARGATSQAARDLYGAGSVEVATVRAAWAAVRVP